MKVWAVGSLQRLVEKRKFYIESEAIDGTRKHCG